MKYEKKNTIITININFNAWDEVFCDSIISYTCPTYVMVKSDKNKREKFKNGF